MRKFVIERNLQGAGQFTPEQLSSAAAKSCDVLKTIGPEVQWVESFVTPDKFYCIYLAHDPELIRRHAKESGFPADRISEVVTTIDPTTAHEAAPVSR